MVFSYFTVSVSAYSWDEPDILTVDQAVEDYELTYAEEVPTNRYYLLMPNGHNGDLGDDVSHLGEYAPTWYMEMDDGTPATSTPGIYWWDSGVVDPAAWIGYLPSGVDENDPDVYYADVPEAVTTIIWNNGVDGGMDDTDPKYFCCAQSVNIPSEYYDAGESPNYPDGTDSYDNMIYVIDPDLISIHELSGRQTCGGEWYYYYGNGCYGFEKNGSYADCLRDDHYDENGNHIAVETVDPTEATPDQPTVTPTEDPVFLENALNFDATTTGWTDFTKVFCHIWDLEGNESFAAWHSKKEACTDTNNDGIWSYDLAANGFELEEGKLYAVIFSNEDGLMTYNLLLDSTVLGDTAYCDGTFYENPEDSSKTSLAAFWRNQDVTVLGPEKKITSIGNVVGICIPTTTTPQAMFEYFLVNQLANSRTYQDKDDQQILDDIARELALKEQDVERAIANTGVVVDWSVDDSTISQIPTIEPTGEETVAPTEFNPYAHTYTVVGAVAPGHVDGGVLGAAWDITNTDNDLIYDAETGLWSITYTDVPATGETEDYEDTWYEYKIFEDHSWDRYWNDEGFIDVYDATNAQFRVTEDNSTVTICFDGAKCWVEGDGVISGPTEAPTEPSVDVDYVLYDGAQFDVYVPSNGSAILSFTPEESGYYTLESKNSGENPTCYLYDSNFNQISYNDDSNGYDFKLQKYLEAGKTYYYEIREYCGYSMTCEIIFANSHIALVDPDLQTVDEAVEEYESLTGEEVPTNRYYFLMPNGHNGEIGDDNSLDGAGDPLSSFGKYAETWYMEMPDGTPATSTAGIYWWGSGVVDPPAWIGYLPSGVDENDPDVYYADVPEAVTTIYWNNAINGGYDDTDPKYFCCAQSVSIPSEYYDAGESPNYPDGTVSFDNMIYVIDPDFVSISALSG